jgi:hypothetical protein
LSLFQELIGLLHEVLDDGFNAVFADNSIILIKLMKLLKKIFVAKNLLWRGSHISVIGIGKTVFDKVKVLLDLPRFLLGGLKI